MSLRIITLTSDKGNWLLRGFIHQWNKYCGELDKVTIAGFTYPEFNLPENFDFYSIGNFEDYPAAKWSNAIRLLLREIPEELILIMLEDYWLARELNIPTIRDAYEYCLVNQDIVRFDMTQDRQTGGMPKDIGFRHTTDIIESNKYTPYNSSLQASIWNRQNLLNILIDNESPWQFELEGNSRITESTYRVCGTKQYPICYQIMQINGMFHDGFVGDYPYKRLTEIDIEELKTLGYTDK